MKKSIIAAILLATVASAASATEVGANYGRTRATGQNTAGIEVGQQYGDLNVQATFDRAVTGKNRFDEFGIAAEYNMLTLGTVEIGPKVGLNYIRPDNGTTGYGVSAGLQAMAPLTKTVSLVAGFDYDRNQKRVNQYNGSTISVGIKTTF